MDTRELYMCNVVRDDSIHYTFSFCRKINQFRGEIDFLKLDISIYFEIEIKKIEKRQKDHISYKCNEWGHL